MKQADQRWYVCDDGCLYDAALADSQGRERCIKHGSILYGYWRYAGMTRNEIKRREQQEKEDEQHRKEQNIFSNG